MPELPTVTIAIPVLNEEQHIESVIRCFQGNSYPNIVEIIVADGGSTDRTLHLLEKISKKDARVKVIPNPGKKQAAGMNRIIEAANGELLVRADAHAEYAKDYVEKCVEVMLETNALNVSGSQRHVATGAFQAGIALASRTWFGNGGAHYKDPDYEGPSDTVFLGCFKTELLRKIGGYKLLASDYVNEDAELNARLLREKPDSIFVSPNIRVWYYPRESPLSLWKQYYFYGKSRKITQSLHPERTPFRSHIPFLTVSIVILFCLIDILFLTNGILSLALILTGLIISLLASARVVWRFRKSFLSEFWRGPAERRPGFISRVISTWTSIVIMLFAHFSGRFIQELKMLFRKPDFS